MQDAGNPSDRRAEKEPLAILVENGAAGSGRIVGGSLQDGVTVALIPSRVIR
ncbi:hypothetical protein THIOKS12280012 [Thiocapsa sp. KS1]|nr:hypothetical protein THIOKS12280012 [Thiocapsa sp. KS1]